MRNPKFEIDGHQTSNFSLYVHIPFCRNHCPFCHFYHVPEVPDWELYLEALHCELASIRNQTEGPVCTLYIGGGTPTLLPPDFNERFLGAVREHFGTSRLREATIETDGKTGPADLSRLALAGFNRISIGIKSFRARTRELLRVGPLPREDPVRGARKAGFSSVGLDMVYGVKGQTLDEMVSDIETALLLEPDHVSLYALEEKGENGPRAADDETSAAMFRESRRLLGQEGFRQYEITNFAKPGHRCLHNQVYWRDGDYYGLGPSAHSSATRNGIRVRWRNRPEIGTYLNDPGRCHEEISRQGGIDRAREALILGLRMTEGIWRAPFVRRYGVDPLEILRPHYTYLVRQGLLRNSANRIRLTTRGMLLSNEVFVRII